MQCGGERIDRFLSNALENLSRSYVQKLLIDGNVIVNYIYDEAREQNDYGYASVKQNGLWGAVDSKGQIAVSPSYNLDNNILVEFIGKWHLGSDLNLYYFTDE